MTRYTFNALDLVAGLSIAGLLLPEAVAYSSLANMPPQAGVIALFAGILGYGVIGKSRIAIVAATSSSAALLAAVVLSLSPDTPAHRLALSMGLIILTGAFFVVAGLAKFGSISDFIAKPVLRGFAFGLALVIIIKQLAKMVDVHPVIKGSSSVVPFAWQLFSQTSQWNIYGLATGGAALLLLFLLAQFKRMPGGLLVIVIGIVSGQALHLAAHGVAMVGAVHLNLEAPRFPELALKEWTRLGELAFAMVLVLYAESYSSIRTFALKHGDGMSANRDLLALGIANMLSGVFQGLPVGAGYSGASANDAAGAQSKLSSFVAAAVVLLIVLTLLGYLALTPEPVLAAIVIHAVSHTLNPASLRPYFIWQRDRLVIVVAIAAVLALGVMDGLLLGIGISLMMMIKRLADAKLTVLGRLNGGHDFVPMHDNASAHAIPDVLILRPEALLFFANIDKQLSAARRELVAAGPAIKNVVLSLEESPDLDSASIEALRDFANELYKNGIKLWLARLKVQAREVLVRANLPALPSSHLTSLSVDETIRGIANQSEIAAEKPFAAQ